MKIFYNKKGLKKIPQTLSLMSSLLLATPLISQGQSSCNLIQNGNFESYKSPISTYNFTEDNIQSGDATSTDGLPNWQAINDKGGDLYNYDFTADRINPDRGPYGPFAPHNGSRGAIQIQSEEVGGNYSYAGSEYVQQAVMLPTDGAYYAEYWLLKSNLNNFPALNNGFMPMRMEVRPTDVSNGNFNAPYSLTPASSTTNIVSTPSQSSTAAWNRVSGILNLTAGPQYVVLGCYDFGNNQLVNVDFIDDVSLYKIPTAGPVIFTCSSNPVTIGEGCPIPGASYIWSTSGSGTFSSSTTTPQITVTPSTTTTYMLTVALPDGTHFSYSSTTVTVSSGPPPGIVYGLDLNTDNTCGDKIVRFSVSAQDRANNPGATFELTATGANYVLMYGSTDHSSCSVRIRNQSRFDIIVHITSQCGVAGPDYDTGTFTGPGFLNGCPGYGPQIAPTTSFTAYPNPATESLTLPASAESATLYNAQGQSVQLTPDPAGKLDVQSLPNGLYNLRMRQDGTLVNQRIEVKH